MFAPPGFDSDDSSEEETVATSPPTRPKPKFSLKAIFNPAPTLDAADVPDRRVGRSSERKTSIDAVLHPSPAVSKLKRRVRILVKGEDHPDENDPEADLVSGHTTPDRQPESGSAELPGSSKTETGMEILELLRQIVAASKTHPSSKLEIEPDVTNDQGFEGDDQAPMFQAEGLQPQSPAMKASERLDNSQILSLRSLPIQHRMV
ncbi:hypothetical protein JCM24511_03220 [Saitozyma sp. JCM 24511]|nr:hypothetical protein JCM24511_03220 [Saitozyma sp. JCM 24511]